MNKKFRNKFRSQKWKVKLLLVTFYTFFCEKLLTERENYERNYLI